MISDLCFLLFEDRLGRKCPIVGQHVEHGGLMHVTIQRPGQHTTVYNFRVADYHTYFVGSTAWGFGVWVHNTYSVEDYIAKITAYEKYVSRQTARGNTPLAIRAWDKSSGYTAGMARHAANLRRAQGERQLHHLVTNGMVDALDRVGYTGGQALRNRKSPQYLSAAGEHVGYQTWHRQVDEVMGDFIWDK